VGGLLLLSAIIWFCAKKDDRVSAAASAREKIGGDTRGTAAFQGVELETAESQRG
jgi:hypothetical protein